MCLRIWTLGCISTVSFNTYLYTQRREFEKIIDTRLKKMFFVGHMQVSTQRYCIYYTHLNYLKKTSTDAQTFWKFFCSFLSSSVCPLMKFSSSNIFGIFRAVSHLLLFIGHVFILVSLILSLFTFGLISDIQTFPNIY